jgi:hypothetical protein
MPELLAQPTLEPNAQLFRGVAAVSIENIFPISEQQVPIEALAEPALPYAPRHAAETVTLRGRFTQSRLGRKIGASVAAVTVALVGVALETSPATADSGQEYTVTDAASGGVFSRNSPHMDDTPRIVGKGIYPGDIARLICGIPNGETVNGNTTWHKMVNETRPDQGEFWESGSFVGVPDKPGELAPGEMNCNKGQQSDAESLQPAETVKPFVEFDRSAAQEWARKYAEALPPPDVDACTYFASKVLEAGGLPQDGTWNMRFHNFKMNGQPRYGTGTAWVGPELALYLNRLPYVDVIPLGHMNASNNNIPKAKPGDIIAYVWNGDGLPTGIESLGNVEHLSVVTGSSQDNPQYPEVAEWGRDNRTPYVSRGWTYSMKTPGWLQDEKGQYNMFAYLIHVRDEGDL